MKLFSKNNPYVPQISTEQFLQNYSTSRVVSCESVSLFFAKIKDSLQGAVATVSSTEPRYVEAALADKNTAIVKSRTVRLQFFGGTIVSKPESFSGHYVEYLKELNAVSTEVSAMSSKLLDTLKMTVGTFVNEYHEDKVDQIYGQVLYADATKKLPSHKKAIAAYFTAPAGKVTTEVKDVLRSMQDIQVLYAGIESIAETFSEKNVETMGLRIQSVTDMVDTLIQVNVSTGVLTRRLEYKEKLLNAIHITAEYVEYYHALLANWVFYCKSFSELTKALNEFPSQD